VRGVGEHDAHPTLVLAPIDAAPAPATPALEPALPAHVTG
jgi:hypothetical protein